MKVQIFADITDPWSYVGSTRFERAAAMVSILTGEPIELTLRAFQLEPDEPSSGRPLMDAMAERLGGLDKAEFINVQVTAGARITGIDLNFDEAIQANSFDAWRLLTWADEDGPGVQRDLAHQLWRAHFLEGADIGDPFVLATRAALVGLELETAEALLASTEYSDEVRMQVETGKGLGIKQLPYVVVENTWKLEGVHSQNDYVQALSRIYEEWKADESDVG
ncbi:putative DsbA family dithiol-disulfide isomerase [Aeromicrobium panaciterrae]|uniref:DsbA family dithiol-disulfide isomerase n=1 Tax=Aeromicrobium panaciterrae TaxID=363861 RepID=A0ABU1ULA2_9ACTN|nr:DsbA family protein [Aeromicrobium panaciterrae]MDR7085968.1 putative DsbA family dithiol-disulfide isomerase [Aeromicrobium panaciterrae]